MSRKWIYILIILLAAAIRFYKLESFAGFDFDQELAATQAQQILAGKLTLIGQEISVGGIFVGPFYNYVTAILLFLSSGDPALMYYFQAFLGIISCVLVIISSEKINKGSGWIGGLLYAIMFRSVYIDKTAAPSNWLLFLTALSLWIYLRNWKSAYKKNLLLFSIAGFASQLHPAGVTLLVFPIMSTIKSKLISTKNVVTYLFLFSVWFIPLFLFDIRHNFLNIQGLISLLSEGNRQNILSRLFSRTNLWVDVIITSFFPQRSVFGIFLMGILIAVHLQLLSKFKVLLIAGIAPLIVFTLYGGSVFDYYLLPTVVISIVIAAALIQKSHKRLVIRLIGYSFLGLSLVSNGIQLIEFKVPYSLWAKKQVINYIHENSETSPVKVQINSDLGQSNGFIYLLNQTETSYQIVSSEPDFTIFIPADRNKENSQKIISNIGIARY